MEEIPTTEKCMFAISSCINLRSTRQINWWTIRPRQIVISRP